MAYPTELAKSAHRHLDAADALDEHASGARRPHRGVAGYLYGIAGECALKAIMWEVGFRTPDGAEGNAYYAHFPELKSLLREQLQGRSDSRLRKWADNQALMSNWNIRMRYASGSAIAENDVDRWRKQARELVKAMGGA